LISCARYFELKRDFVDDFWVFGCDVLVNYPGRQFSVGNFAVRKQSKPPPSKEKVNLDL